MKNYRQSHLVKHHYTFLLSCALNRRTEFYGSSPVSFAYKYRKCTKMIEVKLRPSLSTTRREINTTLTWVVQLCLVVERWVSRCRSLRTGQETHPSYMIAVLLFRLFLQFFLCPLLCPQTYSLYNSPIKPQILTTERFRSKPFTNKVLDDKKCTVDRQAPKFCRSGIPSIPARIHSYKGQLSLYVDL